MRLNFYLIFVCGLLTACNTKIKNENVTIERELERIEELIYYYPSQVEHTVDSLYLKYVDNADNEILGQVNFLKGMMAYQKGNVDSTLYFLDNAITAFTKYGDKNGQGKCNLVIAWLAEGMNEWEQAKIHYYESLSLLSNDLFQEKGLAYLGLYRCKYYLNEDVLDEFKKGQTLLNKTGKEEFQLYIKYMDCLSALNKQGTYKRLQNIADDYESLGLNRKAGGIYKTMANSCIRNNKLDVAKCCLEKAFLLSKTKCPGISIVPALWQSKGLISFLEKDYDSAREMLNKALKSYEEYGQAARAYHAYKLIYRIDTIDGDYKAGFQHLLLANKYYNKTRKKEKERMARIAEVKSKVELMTETIEKLKNEKKINGLLFCFVLGLLFLVFVIMVLIIRARSKSRQQKHEEKTRYFQSLLVGLGEKRLIQQRLIGKAEKLSTSGLISSDFELCYMEIIQKFSSCFVQLSNNEVRYAVLFALNVSNEVAADIQSVQASSIRKVKQRIRQKLNLDTNLSLEQYLKNFLQHEML